MAKDVDLSSREWTDIVFEGKNKEFGAYVMRKNSPKRHNKAVIIVFGLIVLLVIFLVMMVKGVFKSEAELAAGAGSEGVSAEVPSEEEEIEEEDEPEPDIQEEEDEPEPEPEPEVEEPETADVSASQMITEIELKEEVEKDKELKPVDEAMQQQDPVGTANVEGEIELQKELAVNEVIQDIEEPKPEPKPEPVKVEDTPKPKVEEIVNVAMVEQKPQFKGGETAMYKWLSENIQYPQQAIENGVSGKVIVSFVVEKDGKISNVKVVRGKDQYLDKEAVRVVKAMPKWVPGKNNGAPVRVEYNLPITFNLKQ